MPPGRSASVQRREPLVQGGDPLKLQDTASGKQPIRRLKQKDQGLVQRRGIRVIAEVAGQAKGPEGRDQGGGITDEQVLAAIQAVPRHLFLEKAFEEHAYEDKPFPIGFAQTISQPFTVAYQTALLDVQPGDRILEIGTGSGYQAAVLAVLGARVYSIERQEGLYVAAKELLARLGHNKIRCFFGDGTKGLPDFAPYDKIIVTAGAPVVPEALKNQLRIGGRLIIPVGEDVQYM